MNLYKKCITLFIILFSIILIINCGGSTGGSTGTDGGSSSGGSSTEGTDIVSAAFLLELGSLQSDAEYEMITDDEFLEQLYELLDEIDNTEDGVANLKTYLEENISGYTFTYSADEVLASSAIKYSTSDNIDSSETWIMLKAFVQSIPSLVVDPVTGTLTSLATPGTFITLAQLQSRKNIINALGSGQIDVTKANELQNINTTNPFKSQRELIEATGGEMPTWLAGDVPDCVEYCTTSSGGGGGGDDEDEVEYSQTDFQGTFDVTGSFKRVFSSATCTWNIRFQGTIDITLKYDDSSEISGASARVYGTTSWPTGSSTSASFNCTSGSTSFDDTDSVTGTTANYSWSSDLGYGTWTGAFTNGEYLIDSGVVDLSISYSGGTGSASASNIALEVQ